MARTLARRRRGTPSEGRLTPASRRHASRPAARRSADRERGHDGHLPFGTTVDTWRRCLSDSARAPRAGRPGRQDPAVRRAAETDVVDGRAGQLGPRPPDRDLGGGRRITGRRPPAERDQVAAGRPAGRSLAGRRHRPAVRRHQGRGVEPGRVDRADAAASGRRCATRSPRRVVDAMGSAIPAEERGPRPDPMAGDHESVRRNHVRRAGRSGPRRPRPGGRVEHRHRTAAGRHRHRGAAARERRRVRRRARAPGRRGPALPRAARGRPPAAVRPRPVAAAAAARHRRRLRARDQRSTPSAIERAMGEIDPTNPESMQSALAGGMFEPEQTPEQRPRCAAWRRCSPWSRAGSTRSSQAAAGRRMPGADALREAIAAPAGHWRAGRADVLDAGRSGAAAAPAARGRGAVVGGDRAARDQRPRRGSGPTPTCCRPPRTSTIRSAIRRAADGDDGSDPLAETLDSSRPARRRPRVGVRIGTEIVVEVAVRLASPSRRADTVEVTARPFGARVPLDQRPEPRAVPGDPQMGQLVHQDVVEHPARHAGAAGRTAGSPGRPACRTPTGCACCSTHRTLTSGRRDRRDTAPTSSRERRSSASSLRRAAPRLLASRDARDHLATQRCSSARLNRAGTSTMMRSPSR